MDGIERVLVLDDIAPTREWLAQVAAEAFPGAAMHFAESVAQACRELAQYPFDLALIDLGLGDGSGIDVLVHAQQLVWKPIGVVTTVFDDDRHVFAALRAGAQGYLLKDRPAEELAQALAGIAVGQPPLSPSIARRLLAHFAPQPEAGATVRLSPREEEVLRLVAKGFTVGESARSLGLKPSTVAGYVKEIYRKLQVGSRAEAALEAQRRGLV